jgi:hypothetical protein
VPEIIADGEPLALREGDILAALGLDVPPPEMILQEGEAGKEIRLWFHTPKRTKNGVMSQEHPMTSKV